MSKARIKALSEIARLLVGPDKIIDSFKTEFVFNPHWTLTSYGESVIRALCVRKNWDAIVSSLDHGEDFRHIYARETKRVLENACFFPTSTSSLANLFDQQTKAVRAESLSVLKYFADEEDKEREQQEQGE